MQFQRMIGRGSSVVRARNPTPLRTFRETPCYLSCRVRFLPPYPPWTFAIIIFYSHVSCSLDSERYLLQTPLAFFFPPLFKLYSHVLLFFCTGCSPVLGIPRARLDLLSSFTRVRAELGVLHLPVLVCHLQSPFEDLSPSPNSSFTFPPLT